MLKKKEKLRTSTSLHAVTVVFKKVYTTEGLSHWRYFIKFSVCVRKASTKMHFFQHIHTDPRLLHTCISMSWDHTPRRVTFLFTLLFSISHPHARSQHPTIWIPYNHVLAWVFLRHYPSSPAALESQTIAVSPQNLFSHKYSSL